MRDVLIVLIGLKASGSEEFHTEFAHISIQTSNVATVLWAAYRLLRFAMRVSDIYAVLTLTFSETVSHEKE